MANVVEIQRGITELDRQKDEVEAKEKVLKCFLPGNAPYNVEAQAQRVEKGLYRGVEGFLDAGCGLVLIKEYESAQTFAQYLERFRLPLRTAQFWEQFARLCVRSPKFQATFNSPGMVCKGINLLAGLSDPEVEAEMATYEETGQLLGMDEVALHTKTNKELKAENRRLRAERARDGKETALENQRLKKRLEALEAADDDVNKGRKLLEAGDKLLTDGLATLAKADFMLLRKDAAAVAIGRELIFKVRRIADHLEAEMFG